MAVLVAVCGQRPNDLERDDLAQAVLAASGRTQSALPFAHGAVHDLSDGPQGNGQGGDGPRSDGRRGDGLWLADSYHCSRYNTNTGRLTEAMFRDVFARVEARLDAV